MITGGGANLNLPKRSRVPIWGGAVQPHMAVRLVSCGSCSLGRYALLIHCEGAGRDEPVISAQVMIPGWQYNSRGPQTSCFAHMSAEQPMVSGLTIPREVCH